MRRAQWPWVALYLALVFGALALFAWLLNLLFYEWLPRDVAVWLGAFVCGGILGALVGIRIGRQELAAELLHGLPPAPPPFSTVPVFARWWLSIATLPISAPAREWRRSRSILQTMAAAVVGFALWATVVAVPVLMVVGIAGESTSETASSPPVTQ